MKNTRNIQLQPASLLFGFAAGILTLVSMGQSPQDIRDLFRVQHELGPHPRDIVEIKEGDSFVVPQDKVFVVTAMGDIEASGYVSVLYVNNQKAYWSNNGSDGQALTPITPKYVTVPGGATLRMESAATGYLDGRLLGYLVPK